MLKFIFVSLFLSVTCLASEAPSVSVEKFVEEMGKLPSVRIGADYTDLNHPVALGFQSGTNSFYSGNELFLTQTNIEDFIKAEKNLPKTFYSTQFPNPVRIISQVNRLTVEGNDIAIYDFGKSVYDLMNGNEKYGSKKGTFSLQNKLVSLIGPILSYYEITGECAPGAHACYSGGAIRTVDLRNMGGSSYKSIALESFVNADELIRGIQKSDDFLALVKDESSNGEELKNAKSIREILDAAKHAISFGLGGCYLMGGSFDSFTSFAFSRYDSSSDLVDIILPADAISRRGCYDGKPVIPLKITVKPGPVLKEWLLSNQKSGNGLFAPSL